MFTSVKAGEHFNVTEMNEQVKNKKKKETDKAKGKTGGEGTKRDSEQVGGKRRGREKPSLRGKLIAGCRLLAGCAAAEAAVVPARGGAAEEEERAADPPADS